MNIVKKKFKFEGVYCSSCSLLIEMNLEELEGIKSAHASYTKGIVEVEFNPDKISEEVIIKTITNLGYGASSLDI